MKAHGTIIDGPRRKSKCCPVFITPWMNPTSSQRATKLGLPRDHGIEQRMVGAIGLRQIGIMPGRWTWSREPPHAIGIAARGKETERCRRGYGLPPRGSSTAPGSAVSRITLSPDMTAASERVVGMPRLNIASLTMYSRSTGPSAARAVATPRKWRGDLSP